jgi:hypothetical protein
MQQQKIQSKLSGTNEVDSGTKFILNYLPLIKGALRRGLLMRSGCIEVFKCKKEKLLSLSSVNIYIDVCEC